MSTIFRAHYGTVEIAGGGIGGLTTRPSPGA
jgi:hypothetical protein